jgi:hypothetical protein
MWDALAPAACFGGLLQGVGIHPGPEIPGIASHVVEATVSGITVSGPTPAVRHSVVCCQDQKHTSHQQQYRDG